MNIDAAYKFVQFVYNKNQSGNITPDNFNVLAPIAQMSVVNEILGNEQNYVPGKPVPRYGFGINQKIMEDLRPLIKIPTALTFASGVATYPVDSLYLFNLVETSSQKIITPTEYDEAVILNQSVIRPPIVGRAIYFVLGVNIYILPTSITATLVSYVREPLDPKWNYTIVNAAPVYSSSGSQDFELEKLLHLRIVTKILQAVGVNLSLPQVVQMAAAWEAQGA